MTEYNAFMRELESNNLAHWARGIKKSGCKVMVFISTADYPSDVDKEYEEWCKKNCINKYYVYNENYAFFETEEDALAFKLTWT